MVVKKGDKVKIDYTGTLEDGTVFDSSEKHGQPLEFEIGSGQVIPGFENAIIGMKKGAKKEIDIKPEQAYGSRNDLLIKDVPRDQLPEEGVKQGALLAVQLANGARVPAKVIKVDKEMVSIDFNHPLAGKTLHFSIKLVDVAS